MAVYTSDLLIFCTVEGVRVRGAVVDTVVATRGNLGGYWGHTDRGLVGCVAQADTTGPLWSNREWW